MRAAEMLNEVGHMASASARGVVLPFRAGGRARQSVRSCEDGPELRVELPAGALGDLGHDRLRWSGQVKPSLCLAIDVLADRSRRRSGLPLAPIVSMEARGLGILTMARCDDALVVSLWMAPTMRRWAHSKKLSLTDVWQLFTTRLVWVAGEDGRECPGWATIRGLDWADFNQVVGAIK